MSDFDPISSGSEIDEMSDASSIDQFILLDLSTGDAKNESAEEATEDQNNLPEKFCENQNVIERSEFNIDALIDSNVSEGPKDIKLIEEFKELNLDPSKADVSRMYAETDLNDYKNKTNETRENDYEPFELYLITPAEMNNKNNLPDSNSDEEHVYETYDFSQCFKKNTETNNFNSAYQLQQRPIKNSLSTDSCGSESDDDPSVETISAVNSSFAENKYKEVALAKKLRQMEKKFDSQKLEISKLQQKLSEMEKFVEKLREERHQDKVEHEKLSTNLYSQNILLDRERQDLRRNNWDMGQQLGYFKLENFKLQSQLRAAQIQIQYGTQENAELRADKARLLECCQLKNDFKEWFTSEIQKNNENLKEMFRARESSEMNSAYDANFVYHQGNI